MKPGVSVRRKMVFHNKSDENAYKFYTHHLYKLSLEYKHTQLTYGATGAYGKNRASGIQHTSKI